MNDVPSGEMTPVHIPSLPGFLPDLLRVGSPVFEAHPSFGGKRHGIVIINETTTKRCLFATRRGQDFLVAPYRYLHLDLTDPTGRVHALWWTYDLFRIIDPGDYGIDSVDISRICEYVEEGRDIPDEQIELFRRYVIACATANDIDVGAK